MKYDINSPEHNDPEKFEIIPGTVFDHVMECISNSNSTDPIVNLSILFHDIGKPFTFKEREKNGVNRKTYYGHDSVGIEKISDVCERIPFGNAVKYHSQFAAQHHMNFHNIQEMKKSKVRKIVDSPYFETILSVALADEKSRIGLFDKDNWDSKMEFVNAIRDAVSPEDIREHVNGNVIMNMMGKTKGDKHVGDITKSITDWAIDNNISDKETLIKYAIEKVDEFKRNLSV